MKRIKEGKLYYVLPGGHREDNEELEQTCIREFKEETNLDIIPEELLLKLKESEKHTSFYYKCALKKLSKTNVLPKVKLIGEELDRFKNGDFYEPTWFPVIKLSKIILYPEVLQNVITKLHL
jgi:8-oxo-dGTP pyrophosphatase MutT (NUDIX family)